MNRNVHVHLFILIKYGISSSTKLTLSVINITVHNSFFGQQSVQNNNNVHGMAHKVSKSQNSPVTLKNFKKLVFSSFYQRTNSHLFCKKRVKKINILFDTHSKKFFFNIWHRNINRYKTASLQFSFRCRWCQ